MARFFSTFCGRAVALDSVAIIRNLALSVAALAAFLFRTEFHLDNSVLWIFGIAALLNLLTALLSSRPRLEMAACCLSTLSGIGGWTALVHWTGGATSPFVAGLGLEILLGAMSRSSSGIGLVAAGALSGLWMQQITLGLNGRLIVLGLESGFLLATGLLAAYLTLRWRRSEEKDSRRQAELQQRLERLEKDLEKARILGQVGTRVARLAHGLKNVVHSLRGFTGLIAQRYSDSGADPTLLAGLNLAIDRLEQIGRETLGLACGDREESAPPLERVMRDVIGELGTAFPGVRWSLSMPGALPAVQIGANRLHEVMTIVAQNAAEAMSGEGEVAVELVPNGESLEILVRDHGPGIPPANRSRIFEAGFTTKPDGQGFGLFLARRLMEEIGGSLWTAPAGSEGTLFGIELPYPGNLPAP